MKDEKEAVCSGRTLTPLLLGVFFWFIGVGVFLILISSTSKEVKGAGIIFFILCGMEGSYFLLFWRNKRITMTRDDITYRILIQTDRKICIETGMMENSEEAEKLIKGKGYLCLH